MGTQIKLGEIVLDVMLKDIKHVHLSVYPPSGKVRVSAPLRMSIDNVRAFAISKLGWIKQQQKKGSFEVLGGCHIVIYVSVIRPMRT